MCVNDPDSMKKSSIGEPVSYLRDMEEGFLCQAFDRLIEKIPQEKPYVGTKRDRGLLRDLTGSLIGDFVRAVTVRSGLTSARDWGWCGNDEPKSSC